MSHNTTCQVDAALMGHTCPNGGGFEVRELERNGGTRICINPSCPHQQEKTHEQVHTALVGGKGDQHVIVL